MLVLEIGILCWAVILGTIIVMAPLLVPPPWHGRGA